MPKIQADASPGQSPTLPFCLLPRSLDFTNKCSVYLGPATSLQGILWGPSRNVNFLKGGGGSSWGGLLTPGSPRLGKQPTVQGQTLGFSDPGPLTSKAPSWLSLWQGGQGHTGPPLPGKSISQGCHSSRANAGVCGLLFGPVVIPPHPQHIAPAIW